MNLYRMYIARYLNPCDPSLASNARYHPLPMISISLLMVMMNLLFMRPMTISLLLRKTKQIPNLPLILRKPPFTHRQSSLILPTTPIQRIPPHNSLLVIQHRNVLPVWQTLLDLLEKGTPL